MPVTHISLMYCEVDTTILILITIIDVFIFDEFTNNYLQTKQGDVDHIKNNNKIEKMAYSSIFSHIILKCQNKNYCLILATIVMFLKKTMHANK